MELERDADGSLWFRHISPLHADTLLRVVDWLESDDPRVRDRLLPRVHDDAEEEEQWRRLGAPELERLFASRVEILRGDLQSLARDGELTFCLQIQAGNESAWLCSLNAARLAVFQLHEFDDEDMERDPAELDDPVLELALVRIHILAYMQEMLMEVPPAEPAPGEGGED